jgi:hypothetical protein
MTSTIIIKLFFWMVGCMLLVVAATLVAILLFWILVLLAMRFVVPKVKEKWDEHRRKE